MHRAEVHLLFAHAHERFPVFNYRTLKYLRSSLILCLAMATVTDTVVHRRPALEEETPSNDETKSQPAKENSGPKKKSRRPPRTFS